MITLVVIISIVVIWCIAYLLGRTCRIEDYEDKISILYNVQCEELDKLRKENMDIRFSVQEKVEEQLRLLNYRDKELEKFDITDDEITRAFKKLHNTK